MAPDRAGSPGPDALAGTCPLCRRPNACALAAGASEPCWCTQATFDPALRERAARDAGPARCICAACASTPVGTAPAREPIAR